MGRLFLYLSSREPVDIPPVAESPWQQAIGVLVFQNSSKELGFDEDESTTLLNGLLRNALLLEWAPAPQPHKSSPQANRTLVRRHSSRGLFALLAPSEMLQNEIVQLGRAAKQRQANEVRARLGRPPLPLSATTLLGWGEPGAKPTLAILELLCEHTETTCIWRHSDWGVYATALSHTASTIGDVDKGREL